MTLSETHSHKLHALYKLLTDDLNEKASVLEEEKEKKSVSVGPTGYCAIVEATLLLHEYFRLTKST